MRDFFAPGRSTVHAVNGLCATSHPQAALAAIDLLKAGGNAFDAALAASAVLCVVEPMMTGLGGDCFALLAPKGRAPLIGINGSGRSPRKLDVEAIASKNGGRLASDSVHSITIPTALRAWELLRQNYGSMSWDRLLAPAIDLAENGFAVSPRIAHDWARYRTTIHRSEGGRQHYLTDGKAPIAGQIHRLPGLAALFRLIARDGVEAFYLGAPAEEMLACLQDAGGFHQADDFAAATADFVDPIGLDYHHHHIVELPPNGQGVTALILLDILSRFDLDSGDPHGPQRYHLQIEAMRRAYAMRDRMVADADFMTLTVGDLLKPATIDALADSIDLNRATPVPNTLIAPTIPIDRTAKIGRDTIYLAVVDGDRNAISFINSIYEPFGSGLATPTSGLILHNRGACFVTEPGHPNAIAPNKRPLHTIIPAMILDHNRRDVTSVFGVMGGDFQPMGHAQLVIDQLIFGLDIQEALDSPRVFAETRQVDAAILIERNLSPAVAAALRQKGHRLISSDHPLGGGQGIVIDTAAGTLIGGSDARKDGLALGW